MKILETRRLMLRHLEMDDLDLLFVLYSDPEVRRYFPEGALTFEKEGSDDKGPFLLYAKTRGGGV